MHTDMSRDLVPKSFRKLNMREMQSDRERSNVRERQK